MMTGHAGHFRRRRHGARRAFRHHRGRSRQARGAPHRRLAARQALCRVRQGADRDLRHAASAGLTATPIRAPQQDAGISQSASAASRRSSAGLSEKEARHEAQRCLSCGNCFECDNCYAACPEDAIVRLGPAHGYRDRLWICAPAAPCASNNARATRWKWSPSRYDDGTANCGVPAAQQGRTR